MQLKVMCLAMCSLILTLQKTSAAVIARDQWIPLTVDSSFTCIELIQQGATNCLLNANVGADTLHQEISECTATAESLFDAVYNRINEEAPIILAEIARLNCTLVDCDSLKNRVEIFRCLLKNTRIRREINSLRDFLTTSTSKLLENIGDQEIACIRTATEKHERELAASIETFSECFESEIVQRTEETNIDEVTTKQPAVTITEETTIAEAIEIPHDSTTNAEGPTDEPAVTTLSAEESTTDEVTNEQTAVTTEESTTTEENSSTDEVTTEASATTTTTEDGTTLVTVESTEESVDKLSTTPSVSSSTTRRPGKDDSDESKETSEDKSEESSESSDESADKKSEESKESKASKESKEIKGAKKGQEKEAAILKKEAEKEAKILKNDAENEVKRSEQEGKRQKSKFSHTIEHSKESESSEQPYRQRIADVIEALRSRSYY